jgi:hypothetical protein
LVGCPLTKRKSNLLATETEIHLHETDQRKPYPCTNHNLLDSIENNVQPHLRAPVGSGRGILVFLSLVPALWLWRTDRSFHSIVETREKDESDACNAGPQLEKIG